MESLRIHLFKDSLEPFVALMDAHGIAHEYQAPRPGVVMASGALYEVLANAAVWGPLSLVLVAFIKRRNGRKIMLTQKDGGIVHIEAENYSVAEVEKLLANTKFLMAIDPNKPSSTDTQPPT
jgi:hypothetical protein